VTLTLSNFFGLLGGLLVLAFVANRLSSRTRIPDVIVLLGSGIVLGPVLHWISIGRFPGFTQAVGTLALILILFAAGLELDLRRARKQFVAGAILAIFSYGLTMAGVAAFCMHVLGMQERASLVVAGAFACMSGSIVLPILDQLNLKRDLKTTLVIEASLGDGLGALVVSVLLGMTGDGVAAPSGGLLLGGVVVRIVLSFLLAFFIAVVAGFLWVRLLPHVSNKQFWQVLTFAAVLMVYSGTHALGASDLFAVMVFGATLAILLGSQSFLNEFGFEVVAPDKSSQILSFHAELAFLVRSFFFVLLGAMIQFKGLQVQILPSLGILGVLLVARVLAVTLSRVAWRGTSLRERELAMLLIPRGLITAVLVLAAIAAMPNELQFLPSLTFSLILFTNILVLVASVRARALSAPPDAPQQADASAAT